MATNADIQFGISDFSHIGQSIIGVFQIISLDSWSTVLYNLMKYDSQPFVPAIFCISLIFLATFFLLNLMLAVIMESYIVSERDELEKTKN